MATIKDLEKYITVRDVQMFLNSFNTSEHKYSQESVKG